jgi:hypothetical protein
MCSPSSKKDQSPCRERRVCAFHRSHDKCPKLVRPDANVFSALIPDVLFANYSAGTNHYRKCSDARLSGKKFLISTTDNAAARDQVGFHWAFIAESPGCFAVTSKSSVRCLPTSPGA